jgi:hypothetical protein
MVRRSSVSLVVVVGLLSLTACDAVKGDKGAQGPQGIQGEQGIQGNPGLDVGPATVTAFNSRIGALESRFAGTRRWSAMGRQATGLNITIPSSEYAIDLTAANSVAVWSPQLPHGATITEWRIQVAYCNDQAGNTLYCRLRRFTPPASVETLATLSLTVVPTTCDQGYTLTSFTPSAAVSDSYTYEVECAQTAAKLTSVYSTSISYTP